MAITRLHCNKELCQTIIWLFIFSIGMAFIESSVVVYLRAMFYPDGFAFPMKDIGNHLAGTEFLREAGTMVMLVSVAFIAGKTKIQRFAYFIFCFAIWDIFYYIFLKLLLDWPASILEWDVLFLIPVVWVGPVLAPVICSFLMIVLALVLVRIENKSDSRRIGTLSWWLIIAGSLVVIVSFTMDYVAFLNNFFSWKQIISFHWISKASALSEQYVPVRFNWWVFFSGIVLICAGIARIFIKRNSNTKTEY
jgi:hypothetical protein